MVRGLEWKKGRKGSDLEKCGGQEWRRNERVEEGKVASFELFDVVGGVLEYRKNVL